VLLAGSVLLIQLLFFFKRFREEGIVQAGFSIDEHPSIFESAVSGSVEAEGTR
jgi:hypothetical protein